MLYACVLCYVDFFEVNIKVLLVPVFQFTIVYRQPQLMQVSSSVLLVMEHF